MIKRFQVIFEEALLRCAAIPSGVHNDLPKIIDPTTYRTYKRTRHKVFLTCQRAFGD